MTRKISKALIDYYSYHFALHLSTNEYIFTESDLTNARSRIFSL